MCNCAATNAHRPTHISGQKFVRGGRVPEIRNGKANAMNEPNPVEKCIYLAAPQISRSLIPCLIIAVQLCTLHSFWRMLNVSPHYWLKNPTSLAQCERFFATDDPASWDSQPYAQP